MTSHFSCPYLSGEVELSNERERHIAENRPDLLPEYREQIAETLAAPDRIRISIRFRDARLFSRWFDNVRGGKHVVVVVVTGSSSAGRHWIITAYIA
jgi:hypothetical protein